MIASSMNVSISQVFFGLIRGSIVKKFFQFLRLILLGYTEWKTNAYALNMEFPTSALQMAQSALR